MCGICGYVSNRETFCPVKFAESTNMIKYRGPDDYGYATFDKSLRVKEWSDEWLKTFESSLPVFGALGFRRLSIIDLTMDGHQPMHDGSKRFWIIYNGEVYNYVEIRDELIKKGRTFRSNTDTEVVLKSYMEWGKACLEKFNGMWAFCILDSRASKMFCARDRFGIKPFYYYYDGNSFIFASEVKQVLKLVPSKAEINHAVFFDYLAHGSYGNETEETFFKSVKKILPGEYLEVALAKPGELNLKRTTWWDFPPEDTDFSIPREKVFENIRDLFEDSVRLRLRSDVPLGTCLSGGLDSSGILGFVDRINKGMSQANKHKAFIIGSIDPAKDETHYAKHAAENKNVELFIKYPDSVDLEEELENFVWHHDEPLISASMFGGWHVYKLAKECGVTVVLDGQGADEFLGGYNSGVHLDFLYELILRRKFIHFVRQLKANSTLHKTKKIPILMRLVKKSLRNGSHHLLPSGFRPSLVRSLRNWLQRDYVKENISNSHVLSKDYFPFSTNFSSMFKRDSYELIKFSNLPGILRQMDRNSMAFSVEARVPFLDYRLAEFLFKLPTQLILRDGYTKYAYREAMKGIIPDKIRSRIDKVGFAMADRKLLEGAIPFAESILERLPLQSPIFDVEKIKLRFRPSVSDERLYKPIIWRILNAIIWQNKFNVYE